MVHAIFAGDRRVWRWAAAAGLPFVALIAVWCLVPRPYYTGTDSVNEYTVTAPIAPGRLLCARGLNLPAGTARVQLVVSAGSALQMTLHAGGRSYRSSAPALPAKAGIPRRVDFPIPELVKQPASVPASLCVKGRGIVGWGDTPVAESIQPPVTVGGVRQDYRLAVWYLPRAGARRSYLAEARTIFDRATRFAAGFVRPWLFYVVLFALLPALAVLAVRCLALAAAGHVRRMVLWLYVIAALNGAAWSVITPAFQAPDEVDHFAYEQALVERGQKPTPYPTSPRSRWSTAENDALLGIDFSSDHQVGDSRAPSLLADARSYQRLIRKTGNDAANGGGYSAMSTYGPLYYYAVAPGYLIASGGSVFSQLELARLCSALIGALVAAFTFLLVAELVPSTPWLAVLAGLLVCFQPMFSFLSGAVNNDIGIDAGAAAVAYLLIRVLRRGITWPTMLALGILLGALPFVKNTAYELYPLAVVGVAGAVWRERAWLWAHLRTAATALLALAVPWAVVFAAASTLSTALSPGAPSTRAHTVVATTSGSLSVVLQHPLSYLVYLWEVFLPRLPGMHPHFPSSVYPANVIFIHRGWAAFGWYDISFPGWVYGALWGVTGVVVALGLAALWLRRRQVRARGIAVPLLALFPIVVVAGFEAAFYLPGQRPFISEFGRYAFPALAPLATLVVGALYGLPRRWMLAGGTVLLVAMVAFCYASQLLTLTAFYS